METLYFRICAFLGLLAGAVIFAMLLRRPFADFHEFVRSLRLWQRSLLTMFAAVFIAYGSTKTNQVDQVKVRGEGEQWNLSTCFADQQKKESNILCSPSPFTFTSTLPALLSLGAVGRGESFDFSAPEGAMVATNWLLHGATTGRIRVSPSDWDFPFGTNVLHNFAAFADGRLEPWPSGDGVTLAPLIAPLGIVPAANWPLLAPANRPSLFWWAMRGNALVCTWQNVLLGREIDCPVSFQAELRATGGVTYRYDLGRLASDDPLTNVAVLAGSGEAISRSLLMELAQSYTSGQESASPLSASPFSDSLLSRDLTSLVFRSVEEVACDECAASLAAAMGGADPFACPAGSTNTIFEHVFYTGTTNAPFAYPSDTADTAVLVVTVSGVGSGELRIGDTVVPLLARPRPRLLRGANGAPDPTATTLRVPVPRGTVQTCFLRVPESLEVALSSAEFVYGQRPTFLHPFGWLAFPNTKAKEPCIHDLNSREVDVALDPGFAADGLVCTWHPTDRVGVEVRDSLSATLTGRFSPSSTAPVTYTLSHPQYISGETNYMQTVRFCPRIGLGNLPEGDGHRTDEDLDPDEWWCDCGNCEIPWCPCSCHDCDLISEDDTCPDHGCPWTDCEQLHRREYDSSRTSPSCPDVLKLGRNPPDEDEIEIDVPEGFTYCCPCPEHWTNKVSLAYKSHNLAVRDETGERFTDTPRDCTVFVSGLAPSRAVGDSTLALCKTGVVSETHNYTVLGMRIESPDADLQRLNAIKPSFGLPLNVQTNLLRAQTLLLRTDVRLSGGNVRLAFEGDGPRMQLWFWDCESDSYSMLVDSEDRPSLDLPIGQWRRLVEPATCGRVTEVALLVFSEGSRRLVFGYSLETPEGAVRDEASQVVTAIRPPLLPDYDRDGKIGSSDAEALSDGRQLHFWTNEDTWTGDDAFEPSTHGFHVLPMTLPSNGDDRVVNGRNDLVNLCPFAVDISVLKRNWRSADLVYEFAAGDPGAVRFVEAKTGWDEVGEMVKADQETVSGSALHAATLQKTSRGDDGQENGYELSGEMEDLNAQGRGVLAVEFARPRRQSLRIRVRERNSRAPLVEFPVEVSVHDVHEMYRWINLEAACGASSAAKYNTRTWVSWPDSEHADANVVFVHGYNMHPSEAWDWSQAMFKRLWWSGMDAGFTAVLWKGNYSQVWIPGENSYATLNYHQNVLNAFRTASALKAASDSLPGAKKFYIAHSLGNMLVSAAKQDHGLEYEKYVMLNAAVPVEAYDPDGGITAESKFAQTPSEWRAYPDRVRATHWHDLFPDGDARRTLTWSNRFANVDNTINFYSSKDEVVANGDDSVDTLLSRDFAWYNQERMRGRLLVSASPQAGWVFNDAYFQRTIIGHNHGDPVYGPRRLYPSEAEAIAPEQLRLRPFFRDFRDAEIYGEEGSTFVRTNAFIRWYALSHGIPAESFAAGANPVPKWGGDSSPEEQGDDNVKMDNLSDRNVNMAVDCNPDRNPDGTPNGTVKWIHSYFIQRSLNDTKMLYEKLTEIINGKPNWR